METITNTPETPIPVPTTPEAFAPVPAPPETFAPVVTVFDTVRSQIQSIANSAFGKALAAAIIAEMPIGSIIAIIMGSKALRQVEGAYALGAQYGVCVGGKCIAAKVLGKVGKIAGIAMTAFWAVYFLWIILYIIIYIFIIGIAVAGNVYA